METPMLDTTSTFSSLSFFLHFHFSFTFLHFCRWGTRRTLRGAECSRPATGATSRSSSGRSSPRRRRGWDTTLMNCSWGLWCRWGEILGTKLIWILYDRARFRLRENNAHSRQPQATIKETVKGFFNLLAGKGDEKRKSCRNLNIWRPRKGCWQYSYISHITEIMIISRIKYYRDDAYVKLLNYFTSASCIFLSPTLSTVINLLRGRSSACSSFWLTCCQIDVFRGRHKNWYLSPWGMFGRSYWL